MCKFFIQKTVFLAIVAACLAALFICILLRNKESLTPQSQAQKQTHSKSYLESTAIEDIVDEKEFCKLSKKINNPPLRNSSSPKNNQMLESEARFLYGIVKKYSPKKILEIGTLFGGSSAYILDAIKHDKDARLFSVDISKEKEINFVVRERFAHLKSKQTELFGDGVWRYIEDDIKQDIDLIFLDSSHMMPGEILDFLIAAPFLSKNAIVVIHDTATHMSNITLLASLSGERLEPSKSRNSGNIFFGTNIGAVRLENANYKDFSRLITLLRNKWNIMLSEKDISKCSEIIHKYYGKDKFDEFQIAVKNNKIMHEKNIALSEEHRRLLGQEAKEKRAM